MTYQRPLPSRITNLPFARKERKLLARWAQAEPEVQALLPKIPMSARTEPALAFFKHIGACGDCRIRD
jgi:hypothetical protein